MQDLERHEFELVFCLAVTVEELQVRGYKIK
jgi:hypothetical protein